MATFLVRWSEGDAEPRVVAAPDFGAAVEAFILWVQNDDAAKGEEISERADILRWIYRVDQISEKDPITC